MMGSLNVPHGTCYNISCACRRCSLMGQPWSLPKISGKLEATRRASRCSTTRPSAPSPSGPTCASASRRRCCPSPTSPTSRAPSSSPTSRCLASELGTCSPAKPALQPRRAGPAGASGARATRAVVDASSRALAGRRGGAGSSRPGRPWAPSPSSPGGTVGHSGGWTSPPTCADPPPVRTLATP